MKILHIVRNTDDDYIAEIAAQQAGQHEVACLLLHDAVYTPSVPGIRPFGGVYTERSRSAQGKTHACAADVAARGVASPAETVDYEGIVRLIFEHDKVICW